MVGDSDPATTLYRPFDVIPVELTLRILAMAAGCSQGTYKSLLLINKRMFELTRLEALSQVAVILTRPHQLWAFQSYLGRYPEAIPHIHALWTICPGSVKRILKASVSIIGTCTYLRALACHPHVLLKSICWDRSVKHTQCVDLTIFQFRLSFEKLLDTPSGSAFFDQLHRLRFLGALDQGPWPPLTLPKLKNLIRASIAMGSSEIVNPVIFQAFFDSPKLRQVVFTTHLQGSKIDDFAQEAQMVDGRINVIRRRRRWKETNMWHESLSDNDRFWREAKEESEKPQPPRRYLSRWPAVLECVNRSPSPSPDSPTPSWGWAPDARASSDLAAPPPWNSPQVWATGWGTDWDADAARWTAETPSGN